MTTSTNAIGRKKSPTEMVDYRARQYYRATANLLAIEAEIEALDKFEVKASDLPESQEKAFNRADAAYRTLVKAAANANVIAPQHTHFKTL